MTILQAQRRARKLWGKRAFVECARQGAFVGDDGQWHTGSTRVCEHGRMSDHDKCPRNYYIKQRKPDLLLGKVKYPVAEYKVGTLGSVAGFAFFSVKGYAESWEKAFEQAERSSGI